MKKYRVNVNGTVYEVDVEDISGAAPVAAPAAAPAAGAAATATAAVTPNFSSIAFTSSEHSRTVIPEIASRI